MWLKNNCYNYSMRKKKNWKSGGCSQGRLFSNFKQSYYNQYFICLGSLKNSRFFSYILLYIFMVNISTYTIIYFKTFLIINFCCWEMYRRQSYSHARGFFFFPKTELFFNKRRMQCKKHINARNMVRIRSYTTKLYISLRKVSIRGDLRSVSRFINRWISAGNHRKV